MRTSVASVGSQILLGIVTAVAAAVWQVAKKQRGAQCMNPNSLPSSIGISAFVISVIAGIVGSAALKNPAPLFALGLVGLYLMFAIKVADQWQRVAVLRLGRYVGLRGPGIFMIVPIVDTLSRYVDQR